MTKTTLLMKKTTSRKIRISTFRLGKKEMGSGTIRKCSSSREDITNLEELFLTKDGLKTKMSGHLTMTSSGPPK